MPKVKAAESIVFFPSPLSAGLITGRIAVGLEKLMIKGFEKSCNL